MLSRSSRVWFGHSPETDNESESKDVGWLKCSATMPTITAFQPIRERSTLFRGQLIKSWYCSLRRRSQKRRIDWRKITRLGRRWIPANHICHLGPTRASTTNTQGRARCGSVARRDLCGGARGNPRPTATAVAFVVWPLWRSRFGGKQTDGKSLVACGVGPR